MDKESFLIYFNSQGANVLTDNTTSAGRCNISYYVNWATILPKKYKKFHCQFIFKSLNYAGLLTDNGFVNLNCGRVNVFDGQQMTNNLGIIYPVATTATTSFYNSTNNDNNDFWMDYPINNQITLTLKTFSNINMGNMPHYCLYLSLIGILDEDIDKSN